MEELSSSTTAFYKIAIPALWTALVAFILYEHFFGEGPLTSDIESAATRWFFWAAFLAFNGLLYGFFLRLKSVELSGEDLIITNYQKALRVPLRNVQRASSSPFRKPGLIWIHFKTPTEFGRTIFFIPPWSLTAPGNPHPLESRLNDLVLEVGEDE